MGGSKLSFKLKIILSLSGALFLSYFLYRLGDGTSPFFYKNKLLALKDQIIASLNFVGKNNSQTNKSLKTEIKTVYQQNSSLALISPTKTVKLINPSPTLAPVKNHYSQLTTPSLTPLPTLTLVFPTNIIYPTEVDLPNVLPTSSSIAQVNTIKPTKPPKPTPLILQTVRPGKNFDEVVESVSQIICIPKAMVRAVLQEEYGPWLKKIEADWTNKNTYHGPDPDYTGSTQIMGVMQMMGDTWQKIKPVVSSKVGGVDLSINVTYDAILGAAYHLWNISTYRGKDCQDWSLQYIAKAACKYGGGCIAGSRNYCLEVCNYYNQFSRQHKNCSKISKILSSDGKCNIIGK
jgi:hypothetical protein